MRLSVLGDIDRAAAEKHLDVLHDHYKESFGRVRELERSRDRNFLWTIVLFGLLALQVGYPAEFGGSIQRISLLGGEMNLRALPLAALLSATWVLALAVSLRYCSISIAVDRQYPYVHYLEEQISPMVGGDQLYQREGYVYLTDYPMLLNVAWLAYVVVFPLIVTAASIAFLWWEWRELPYQVAHQVFDTAIGTAVIGCFFLYRVQPYVARRWRRWRENLPKRKQEQRVPSGPPPT